MRTPVMLLAASPVWVHAALWVLAGIVVATLVRRVADREGARIRAERALRVSEERHRLMTAHIPDVAVCLLDRELRIVVVEGPVAERRGHDAAVIGRPIAEIVPPAQATALRPRLRDALAGEASSFDYQGADGATFEVRSVPYRSGGEAVDGVLLVFHDVSVRVEAQAQLRISEERNRLIVQNLPDTSIGLWDAELRLTQVSGTEDPRWDPERAIGLCLHEILDPESALSLEPRMHAALLGHARCWTEERDGVTHDYQVLPHRDDAGAITGVLVLANDVTEATTDRRARAVAERRFRDAFEAAPIGMALLSLDGRFIQVNDAMAEITGRSRDELERLDIAAITHPDDMPATHRMHATLLRAATDAASQTKRYVHADGHEVWIDVQLIVVRDEAGEALHFLGQVQDVTERRRSEQRLQHMADHDPLTGLANRRGFERALGGQVAHARRYGAEGALVVLDLDGFKDVNDTLGHGTGDVLIAGVAALLRDTLRDTDVLARLGGDEFAVLLTRADEATALLVAQKACDAVRDGASVPGAGPITASVGVALFEGGGQGGDQVLVNADRAMYEAKARGRDRVCAYAPEASSTAT